VLASQLNCLGNLMSFSSHFPRATGEHDSRFGLLLDFWGAIWCCKCSIVAKKQWQRILWVVFVQKEDESLLLVVS